MFVIGYSKILSLIGMPVMGGNKNRNFCTVAWESNQFEGVTNSCSNYEKCCCGKDPDAFNKILGIWGNRGADNTDGALFFNSTGPTPGGQINSAIWNWELVPVKGCNTMFFFKITGHK